MAHPNLLKMGNIKGQQLIDSTKVGGSGNHGIVNSTTGHARAGQLCEQCYVIVAGQCNHGRVRRTFC